MGKEIDFCESVGERSGHCAEAKKRGGHGSTFVLDSGYVLLRDYANVQDEDITHLSQPSLLLAISSYKCAELSVRL
jgi:hypothetical protein